MRAQVGQVPVGPSPQVGFQHHCSVHVQTEATVEFLEQIVLLAEQPGDVRLCTLSERRQPVAQFEGFFPALSSNMRASSRTNAWKAGLSALSPNGSPVSEGGMPANDCVPPARS